MGKRLRRRALGVLTALLLALSAEALAEEFTSCWVDSAVDPITLQAKTITTCRISGGDTVDYASDSSVPSRLYPALGSDLTGECWYYTSRATQFLILTLYSAGRADVGYDPDPETSTATDIVVIGPNLPRCTSEPTPATNPLAEVWDYVTSYIHAPPTPDLNPRIGEGVTGMDTFLGVAVPDPHATSISSGTSSIDLEIEVSLIHVDWGDGSNESYPSDPDLLSGYPDGLVAHLYETKDPDGVPIVVSYDWTARWRLGGGAWEPLDVPNTTTAISYPLSEVISVLTR